MLQTKALRGSRRPEVTFEARGARPGGVLSRAFLEAEDNDEYESESDADAEPMQHDSLRRRDMEVSLSQHHMTCSIMGCGHMSGWHQLRQHLLLKLSRLPAG